MSQVVLVTPRSLTALVDHPEFERVRAAGFSLRFGSGGSLPDEAELVALLDGCVGYIAGVEPITRSVLEQVSGLRVISRHGSGMDNIDVAAAAELGLVVHSARGANARSVAELTLGFIFSLARSVVESDRDMKAGQWARSMGMELRGKRVGVIGYGEVGTEVVRLVLGMGMVPVVYDPGRGRAQLDDLTAECEVITLHCPPGAEPLVNREILSACKPGLLLVNAARGELLDDAAVLEALNSGHLAGVAIDTWRNEPPGEDALVMHSKVIATPHIGGYTGESIDATLKRAVDQLLAALQDG